MRNLQNALRNFEIADAQFVKFWHKPDPDSYLNPNPGPNLNSNITIILTLAKSRSAYCITCRLTNCVQPVHLLYIALWLQGLHFSVICDVWCREIQQQLHDKVETLRKQWANFLPHLAIIQVSHF